MNGDESSRLAHQNPLRRPVILIGAPSGAGKTVLSRRIIAGALPLFTQLCGGMSDESPIRHDWKVLPRDLPRDRILIVECSTHKFAYVTHTDQWKRVLDVVRESERVILVNLDVPRRTLVRQYLRRIFTGPKEVHVIRRALHVSKYRNALTYAFTRQVNRSKIVWREFCVQLAVEMAPRVCIVHARRFGADYDLTQVSELELGVSA